jgi:hypothetical protein
MVGDTALSEWIQILYQALEDQQAVIESMQGADTRSLLYPDGLNGIEVVNHDFIAENEYTVPLGKNLYIQQLANSGGCGTVSFNVSGLALLDDGVVNLNDMLNVPLLLGESKVINASTSSSSDCYFSMHGFLVPRIVNDTVIHLRLDTYQGIETPPFIVPENKVFVFQYLSHSDEGGAIYHPYLAINGVTVVEIGE